MNFTDTTSPEAVALTAACQIHSEIVGDDAFAGYDGTKEAFDRLYKELFVIARDEVSLEIDPVDQVISTFFDYLVEIEAGQREVDWYL